MKYRAIRLDERISSSKRWKKLAKGATRTMPAEISDGNVMGARISFSTPFVKEHDERRFEGALIARTTGLAVVAEVRERFKFMPHQPMCGVLGLREPF